MSARPDRDGRRQNATTPADPTTSPPMVSSSDLLNGRRELVIRHGAERCRLLLTARSKLILTKQQPLAPDRQPPFGPVRLARRPKRRTSATCPTCD